MADINRSRSDPEHYLKDREVKEFIEAHPDVFTIEETTVGKMAATLRAQGTFQPGKSLGEAAIAGFFQHGLEKYVLDDPAALLLFEDADIRSVKIIRRPRNVRAPSEHGCVAPRTAGDRHPRVGRERHPSDDASNRSVAASPQIQRPSGRRRRSSRDREHLAPVKTGPGRIDGADVRPAGADLGRRRQDPWVHRINRNIPSDLPLKTSTLPCSCAEASTPDGDASKHA